VTSPADLISYPGPVRPYSPMSGYFYIALFGSNGLHDNGYGKLLCQNKANIHLLLEQALPETNPHLYRRVAKLADNKTNKPGLEPGIAYEHPTKTIDSPS
jgi:hypothetical protein